MIRTDQYNKLMKSQYVFSHKGILLKKYIYQELFEGTQKNKQKETKKRLNIKPEPLF